jgi:calcium-dependent protein kinase
VLRAVVEDRVVMDDEFWLTNISEGARDLTARLLDRDPMTRLTAQEALEHPWVKVGGECDTLVTATRALAAPGRGQRREV